MTDGLDDDDAGGQTVLGAPIIASDEPPSAVPCVVVLTGSAAGGFLRVPEGAATIGRAPSAQLRFEEAGISRNHARIRTDGTGRAWLEDLGSSNGTFLNTQRITAEQQLRDGDTIQIGFTTVLRFVFEELPELAIEDTQDARDPMTGVFDRDYLVRRLAAELTLARRRQLALSILVLEVDDAAALAARHGPAAADAAVSTLASVVLAAKRADELVARYDDTKLAIVLRACGSDAAKGLAGRLRQAIGDLAFSFHGHPLQSSVSMGVAGIRDTPVETAADLLAAADEALARAKRDQGTH